MTAPKLSKAARQTMERISKNSGRGTPRFHSDNGRTYYLPNGKVLKSSHGLRELLEAGYFKPAGDGLFPGHDQT